MDRVGLEVDAEKDASRRRAREEGGGILVRVGGFCVSSCCWMFFKASFALGTVGKMSLLRTLAMAVPGGGIPGAASDCSCVRARLSTDAC